MPSLLKSLSTCVTNLIRNLVLLLISERLSQLEGLRCLLVCTFCVNFWHSLLFSKLTYPKIHKALFKLDYLDWCECHLQKGW